MLGLSSAVCVAEYPLLFRDLYAELPGGKPGNSQCHLTLAVFQLLAIRMEDLPAWNQCRVGRFAPIKSARSIVRLSGAPPLLELAEAGPGSLLKWPCSTS